MNGNFIRNSNMLSKKIFKIPSRIYIEKRVQTINFLWKSQKALLTRFYLYLFQQIELRFYTKQWKNLQQCYFSPDLAMRGQCPAIQRMLLSDNPYHVTWKKFTKSYNPRIILRDETLRNRANQYTSVPVMCGSWSSITNNFYKFAVMRLENRWTSPAGQ